MKLLRVLFVLAAVAAGSPLAVAQISAGGTPPSFSLNLSTASVPTVTMAATDNATLRSQVQAEEAAAAQAGTGIPYRFAYIHDVSLNLHNSGIWETLPDGSRLWRLRIASPSAYSLHFIYDHWWLPKGAELFIYNDDHSDVIGAFTRTNNWIDTTNVTQPVNGDAATLEYHLAAGVTDPGLLSISRVFHAFRSVTEHYASPVDTFNQSSSCEVNINCPAGANWQSEKRAVAMLFMPDGSLCSGALMNNTNNDWTPYFLSAYHCYPSGTSTNFLVRFNYESPNCSNQDGPYNQTVANATVISRYDVTDFLLLRLSAPPPFSYNPYYAGYNWDFAAPGGATEIAHPMGDIKKISVRNSSLFSTDWNGNYADSHWGLYWDVGTAEPGSSGSPWFDTQHLVVGQLHGGNFACTGGYDAAGKLYYSWQGGQYTDQSPDLYLNPASQPGFTYPGAQPAPPPNDLCANAIPIFSVDNGGFLDNGYTTWASVDYANCTNQNSPDVWYQLMPQSPCSWQVTVNTCGSDFDTELEVVHGSCNQILDIVGCNDDACGLQSQVTFTTIPGESYLFIISGFGGARGHYWIQATGTQVPPQNDTCPGFPITSIPYTNTGNTTCAGSHFGFNSLCSNANTGHDVVWTFTPPCDGTVNVNTFGSDFDTILEMDESEFNHTCESAFTFVACNDDADYTTLQSQITPYVYAGHTYRIQVGGYNQAYGNYVLNVVAGNSSLDHCPGQTISALPYFYQGSTACMTDDFSPSCLYSAAPDVIFSYTPATCHLCQVSLCGSGYDTGLYVRAGGACPGISEVACNDDYCGLQSQLNFDALQGITYYIIVDGYAANSGPYTLNVSNVGGFIPANDVCGGAPVITSLPYTDYGNTACAANDYNDCVGTSSPEVVYRIMLPSCSNVTVSLCGSSYDTGLGIYGGTCQFIGPLIVCNDDNYCGSTYTLQSTASFQAQANTNYTVLVHGYGLAAGLYVINITGTPCAPAAVTDLVIKTQTGSGDVNLNWTATANATAYEVFRAWDQTTLFNAGNQIGTSATPTYTCSGCAADTSKRSFFGVIAENQSPAPMALSAPGGNASSQVMTKDHAVQGPVSVNYNDLYPYPNVEHASPDKAKSLEMEKAKAGNRPANTAHLNPKT